MESAASGSTAERHQSRPTSLTIYSIAAFVVGFLLLLFAVLVFVDYVVHFGDDGVFSRALVGNRNTQMLSDGFPFHFPAMGVFFFLLFIMGLLLVVAALGLWRRKSWSGWLASLLTIVLLAITSVNALYQVGLFNHGLSEWVKSRREFGGQQAKAGDVAKEIAFRNTVWSVSLVTAVYGFGLFSFWSLSRPALRRALDPTSRLVGMSQWGMASIILALTLLVLLLSILAAIFVFPASGSSLVKTYGRIWLFWIVAICGVVCGILGLVWENVASPWRFGELP